MFLFVTIVGGFMTYAYLNGSTATTIENHERRLDKLEDSLRHK
jgi:hypothetical protein